MSNRNTAYILGFLAGIVATLAAVLLIGPLNDALPGHDDQSRTDQAREIIESSYFKKTDGEKLEDASINAMVKKISKQNDDKFSTYFNAKQYKQEQEITSGQFSGIGLTVSDNPRGLEVSQVYEDTPAEDAGLKTGDLIVAVEGESLRGVSSDVAASKIKGPPGTEVEITVVDGKTGKRRTIDVERANVKIPAVTSKMLREDGKKIGYVRLSTFSAGAGDEMRKAIDDLKDKGAEGLVFDLRDNGGGLLDEAVAVTSIFQDSGPVVSIDGRERDKQVFNAQGNAVDTGPVAVLVNGNTASASEITSAALQENDLATIIGTTTYGKGVFQEEIPLDGGGALHITVGEYLTADGTSILGKGVIPDERVVDEDPRDKDDTVLEAGLQQVGSEIGGN